MPQWFKEYLKELTKQQLDELRTWMMQSSDSQLRHDWLELEDQL